MRIFCDMDGVLADFNKKYKDITGLFPWEFKEQSYKYLQMNSNNEMSKFDMNLIFVISFWMVTIITNNFWESIPQTKGFKKLWKIISKYDPIIITAVPEFMEFRMNAVRGKRFWIDKYCNPDLQMIILNLDSFNPQKIDKSIYCKYNDDILIDDNRHAIETWREKGGIGIMYYDSQYEEAIQQLKSAIRKVKSRSWKRVEFKDSIAL